MFSDWIIREYGVLSFFLSRHRQPPSSRIAQQSPFPTRRLPTTIELACARSIPTPRIRLTLGSSPATCCRRIHSPLPSFLLLRCTTTSRGCLVHRSSQLTPRPAPWSRLPSAAGHAILRIPLRDSTAHTPLVRSR